MVIMLVLVMVMGMVKFIVEVMGGSSKHFTVATYLMDCSANRVLKYMFEKERLDFEGTSLNFLWFMIGSHQNMYILVGSRPSEKNILSTCLQQGHKSMFVLPRDPSIPQSLTLVPYHAGAHTYVKMSRPYS